MIPGGMIFVLRKIKGLIRVESKTDWLSNILGTMKKMDPEQMQSYISHLSQALGAVQGVLTQFQNGTVKKSSNSSRAKAKSSLFI